MHRKISAKACMQEFRMLQGEGQEAWAARCILRKQLRWLNSHEVVSPTASIATPGGTPRKERRCGHLTAI